MLAGAPSGAGFIWMRLDLQSWGFSLKEPMMKSPENLWSWNLSPALRRRAPELSCVMFPFLFCLVPICASVQQFSFINYKRFFHVVFVSSDSARVLYRKQIHQSDVNYLFFSSWVRNHREWDNLFLFKMQILLCVYKLFYIGGWVCWVLLICSTVILSSEVGRR